MAAFTVNARAAGGGAVLPRPCAVLSAPCTGRTPWAVISLLLLLSVLLLTGCSRQRPGTTRNIRTPDGKIVLQYWNGFTGPDGTAMEKMVRAFEAANPDIRVQMQLIPWGTYYDKLTLALAYGGAPDVFVLQADRFPEFASYGTLRPLKDLYQSSQPRLTAADFVPAPWRASFYHNTHYALPLDVHPLGLYYNTRLFKEAGIVDSHGNAVPPTNWPEFLRDAQLLTRHSNGSAEPDQWGFAFTNQQTFFQAIAWQFGGSFVTPDGKSSAMDSPANVKTLEIFHDLIYRYRVAPKPEGVDSWLEFRQGRVAMVTEGIYMLASLQEQKDLAFAGAPVFQIGPQKATWAGSHLLCMPVGISPERAKAAWRLMRFLSDHSITWATGGQVPARLSVLHSRAFAALPVQSQFARELPYVKYILNCPRLDAVYPFSNPAIEAVLLDLQTPQQALRDANRRINQVLHRP